ncbi:MAG: RAMP superfamily CRISPR-associated protein, partial [Butyricicoccus porcorum]
MSRVCLTVQMKLSSDTIFSSGYSIPGGEDISIKRTEDGMPYLSGSTMKGLLRETIENYLVWTKSDETIL